MMFAIAATLSLLPLDCGCGSNLIADEYTIDESIEELSVGDFSLSLSRPSNAALLTISSESEDITAGELWKFFHENGMARVDKLTLSLDVDPGVYRSDVEFNDLVLTIGDPFNPQETFQTFSLDSDDDEDTRMVLPFYESTNFKPEAELQIDLGYDFMQRYTESSTELVKLNFRMNEDSHAVARFSFVGKDSFISQPNYLILITFMFFWTIVFLLMFRFIKPSKQAPPARVDKPAALVEKSAAL